MRIESANLSLGTEVPHDEATALIQRILTSRTFHKTPKLREFLQFVCECFLRNGTSEEVKEQQIGLHVFHRRYDYNTSDDSIVRVHARELRKRLETYFQTEGKDEPIILTIPKGGYSPLFGPAILSAQKEPALEMAQPPRDGPERDESRAGTLSFVSKRTIERWILMLFGGTFLLVAGWLVGSKVKDPSPRQASASGDLQSYAFYKQLLGPIGTDGNDVLLLLSNPRVLIFAGIPDKSTDAPNGTRIIPVPPELRKRLEAARNLNDDPTLPASLSIENSTYTGIGEAASAYNIGRLMLLLGRPVRLTQGRFLNWDAAKREDLIILGNPDIDVWSHSNIPHGVFQFIPTGIRNSVPQIGEETVYRTSTDPLGDPIEDYGVIRMARGGSGIHILSLAGRTSAGTYGVGDFFADPEKMRGVFQKLNPAKSGQPFPESWEALIRVSVRDNIPVNSNLITVRVTNPTR